MAGLIQNAMSGTQLKKVDGVDTFDVNTTTYDPALRTVDQGQETVQGQLKNVLAADSPVLQQARAGATQTMNRRGLINSSMAAEAGESAVIGAATPIAAADAGIYGTAARENQQAQNRAFEVGAGETNANARLNADAGNQIGRMGYGATLEKGLIGSRLGAEKETIAAQGAEQRTTIGAQAGAESQLSAQQAAQQQAQAQVQGEIQKGLLKTQGDIDARTRELAGQIEQQLIGARAGAESKLQAERVAGEKDVTQLRGQIETQLQQLRGGQAENLAQIEAGYKQLIQANASAGSLYQDSVKMIAAIMADLNTTPEQKQQAVNKVSSLLESGLGVIGGIANVDIAGLLDFSAQGV